MAIDKAAGRGRSALGCGVQEVMAQAVRRMVDPNPQVKPNTPLQSALNELGGAVSENAEASARLRASLVGVLQPECKGEAGSGCEGPSEVPMSELVQTLRGIARQIRGETYLLNHTTDRLDV